MGLNAKDLYEIYTDHHKKATEWEFAENDRMEWRQFAINLVSMFAAIVILFSCGDSYGFCASAVISGALSLTVNQLSSEQSQKAIAYYRDFIIQPDMQVKDPLSVEYDKMRFRVRVSNATAYILSVATLSSLVARCLLEG